MRAHHRPCRSRPLLVAALLGVVLCQPAAHAQETDRAAAEAELARITERLNDLSAWLVGAERKRAQWQREIQASDRAVARLARDVETAGAAVTAAHADIAALHQERERLQAQRARQAQHIGRHLTSAYRLGGEDFIKLLLNQQSPETFDRMVRYHRYFSEARLATLQAYRQTLERLEQNEAQLRTRAEEAQQLRQAREQRERELLAQRDERKALIAKLDEEAEDKAIERERLRADRQRLENLLAELQRKSLKLDGRTFAQSQGRLPWPVDGRVLHGFGNARAEGRMTWHGILIAAEEGAQFRAVQRGRIVFADWLRGFGLMIIVDHGSGYLTLYGQAETLAGKVGDTVEAGDVLGRAGRSGGQKEAGVYFEVRHNGRARDPAAWLAKR
jgi:murein hydrolase activator